MQVTDADGELVSPLCFLRVQELFGELKISAAVTALGPEALSALAALLKHLRRLKADAQFATSAQMVHTLHSH